MPIVIFLIALLTSNAIASASLFTLPEVNQQLQFQITGKVLEGLNPHHNNAPSSSQLHLMRLVPSGPNPGHDTPLSSQFHPMWDVPSGPNPIGNDNPPPSQFHPMWDVPSGLNPIGNDNPPPSRFHPMWDGPNPIGNDNPPPSRFHPMWTSHLGRIQLGIITHLLVDSIK
ncbi:hypothetical protein L6164_001560 [Bauhinia variegata]|uniref:Uncharacterized protein n=1 Tax=Bauhinia variegata TaxID=167791 RepID=A0ACB9Q9W6_BAUVA|nr:hypothetical protein L6164_001560 [Bauhinia variegata]